MLDIHKISEDNNTIIFVRNETDLKHSIYMFGHEKNNYDMIAYRGNNIHLGQKTITSENECVQVCFGIYDKLNQYIVDDVAIEFEDFHKIIVDLGYAKPFNLI